MPVTFGLDISHHQAASLDLTQCKRQGLEFVFIKSSEGSSFTDPAFAVNLAEARAAGMLVAAYHYVRSNSTAAAQVARVTQVVPRDVPVIPDVEANSGGIALVREFVARLQAAGYTVPLTYLPRWYWQQIGSPSLAGLPSLWSSRYPDNVPDTVINEYADVPASYWNGYGGLGVTVLQYTSAARVPGYAGNLDANAYQGTRNQLAAVLGSAPSSATEDDMVAFNVSLPTLVTAQDVNIALPWEGGITSNKVTAMVIAGEPGLVINVAHWRSQASNTATSPDAPVQMVPDGTTIAPFMRTAGTDAPERAHALIINYTGSGAVMIEGAK